MESKTFKFLDFEAVVRDGMIYLTNSNDVCKENPENTFNLATWAEYTEHIIGQCRRYAEKEMFLNAAERDMYRQLRSIEANAMEIGREAYRQGGAHLMKTESEHAQSELSRMRRDNDYHAAMNKESKIILPDTVEETPKKLIIP